MSLTFKSPNATGIGREIKSSIHHPVTDPVPASGIYRQTLGHRPAPFLTQPQSTLPPPGQGTTDRACAFAGFQRLHECLASISLPESK